MLRKAPRLRSGDDARSSPRPPAHPSRQDANEPRLSSQTKKTPDNNFAARCAKQILQEDWEIDHIVSLQRGGSNDLSNLQALHKRCHAYKNHVEQRG